MKSKSSISLIMLISIISLNNAWAITPWEKYVEYPSPENARKVNSVKYEDPKYENDINYDDLNLLGIQILSGDREALKLAFRLRAESDGAYAEELDIITGRLIRINPKLFLEELKLYKKNIYKMDSLLGNYGQPYVDKLKADIYETKARIKSLKTVNDGKLIDVRDECIKVLNDSLRETSNILNQIN